MRMKYETAGSKKKIIIITVKENKVLQKNLGVGSFIEKLQDITQSGHYL